MRSRNHMIGSLYAALALQAATDTTAITVTSSRKPEERPHKFGRKIGRNEPCPCDSGKKFKRCCIALSQEAKQPPSGAEK